MTADLPEDLVAQVRADLDAGLTASKRALATLLAAAVKGLSAAESSLLAPKDADALRFFDSTNAELTGADAPNVPIRASIAGYVFLTGQTVATDDAAVSPEHNKAVDERTGTTTKEYLAAPIVRGEAIAGVLTFVNRSSPDLGAFSKDEITLAERYADLGALVLDHIEKVRRQTDATAKALSAGAGSDALDAQGFLFGSSGLLSEESDPAAIRTEIETAIEVLSGDDLELVRDIVNRLGGAGSGDAV